MCIYGCLGALCMLEDKDPPSPSHCCMVIPQRGFLHHRVAH